MKLKHRRIIYLAFIGFFVVITPIVILYTAGYRYNFKKNKLEKTGVLYIESKPKGAEIFINEKYKDKTPARFARMLPDAYQIKVEKQGYHPWQKKLEVESNLTTFAKNIVLFKNTLPINIIEGEINLLTVSPSQEKIIYSLIKEDSEEIKLLNINNGSDLSIKKLDNRTYNQLEFAEWSPSQNKIMLKETVGDFNKYLIIDIETLKVKELFDVTKLNFDKLGWDTTNDSYLYGLRKAVLYQIDLVENSTVTLLSDSIKNFQIQGNNIYYITETARESFLNKRTLENGKVNEAQKIKLPSPSEYTFQPSNQQYLALLDKKNNDLFIIKADSFDETNVNENIILQDKAKKIVWSKDLKKFLHYTDFEISTFNFTTQEKNFITRYGEIIANAFWYPDNNYIVYQVGNSVRVIEAGVQDIKNDLKLAELINIDFVVIDSQGENLYFKGEAGAAKGIYKLEIQ